MPNSGAGAGETRTAGQGGIPVGMSVHGAARFATRDEVRQAGLLRDRLPRLIPDNLMIWWDAHDFKNDRVWRRLDQLIVGGARRQDDVVVRALLRLYAMVNVRSAAWLKPI